MFVKRIEAVFQKNLKCDYHNIPGTDSDQKDGCQGFLKTHISFHRG